MAGEDRQTLRRQINSHFGDLLDDKLVEDCITLCQHYGITGEDLLFKWEAMSFGISPRVFNAETIPALKQHIQRELAKQNAKKLHAKSTTSGLMSRNLNARVAPSPASHTPLRPKPNALGASSDASAASPFVAGPSRVQLVVPNMDEPGKRRRRYRYMYEKLSERSGALDDQIDDIAELVQKHYDIVDLSDPTLETEEDVTVVGRIVFDADSSSAGPVKLNEAAMTLESSRALGSGKRVPLKFDVNVRVRGARQGVQGAGFFPGAIVALRGRNGGGGWFLVNEILSLPTPAPRSLPSSSTNREFSMCIAAGPYTADADLKFDAWKSLLGKARSTKPSIGPFVDSNHPFIRNGDLDQSPASLFHDVFLRGLSDLLDDLPGSIAVIVPSVRDIISDHAVFPQSELRVKGDLNPRITMLPNPCRFSVNDVWFAATSVDVLFHLRKEEFFKSASEISPVDNDEQPWDAMSSMCQHLFQQRSFYPIFPPPIDVMHDINFDVSHSDMLDIGDEEQQSPHVLILPSRLKQFSKLVNTVTVINPSTASKDSVVHVQLDNSKEHLVVNIGKLHSL